MTRAAGPRPRPPQAPLLHDAVPHHVLPGFPCVQVRPRQAVHVRARALREPPAALPRGGGAGLGRAALSLHGQPLPVPVAHGLPRRCALVRPAARAAPRMAPSSGPRGRWPAFTAHRHPAARPPARPPADAPPRPPILPRAGAFCRLSHRVQKEHIYHPSVYKTQFCEGRLNLAGECSDYGVHCSKAHGTPTHVLQRERAQGWCRAAAAAHRRQRPAHARVRNLHRHVARAAVRRGTARLQDPRRSGPGLCGSTHCRAHAPAAAGTGA
jgi:hypothetical protein